MNFLREVVNYFTSQGDVQRLLRVFVERVQLGQLADLGAAAVQPELTIKDAMAGGYCAGLFVFVLKYYALNSRDYSLRSGFHRIEANAPQAEGLAVRRLCRRRRNLSSWSPSHAFQDPASSASRHPAATCLAMTGCESPGGKVSVLTGQTPIAGTTYAWAPDVQPGAGDPRVDNDIIRDRIKTAIDTDMIKTLPAGAPPTAG